MNDGADPRRLLRLATALGWTWAAISVVFGVMAAGPLTVALLIGRTRLASGHILYFFACFIVFVVPGLLYALLALLMKQRTAWLVIAGIVVASIHLAFALAGVGLLILIVPRMGGPFLSAPIVGGIAFILGCAHLIWVLARVLKALPLLADDERGFAPIMR